MNSWIRKDKSTNKHIPKMLDKKNKIKKVTLLLIFHKTLLVAKIILELKMVNTRKRGGTQTMMKMKMNESDEATTNKDTTACNLYAETKPG
ncbi:hypothetical protein ElyMa_000732000 [Elysia marginata]|uniref:Uncharacterized protein n=1 Tax=Elysia marginata TaxID=1093978 RepID=A0AAV4GQK5_9GAST|nr:hypothetical protein ElyMa_000732000 [Elysia marginata]